MFENASIKPKPETNISDSEFFQALLNLDYDGMEAVNNAVLQKNYAAARKEYAHFIRTHLNPQRFFSIPYEAPENAYTLENETELEAAERICKKSMVSCGVEHSFNGTVDWYCNPIYNQYPEWTWQLSRHHEFKLLAHVYRETKDEKYAACCAELFSSWFKQTVFPEKMPDGWPICWRTIECGIRMGTSWSYALHAFYQSPHFTDDILVDWAKSVCTHGILLREKHKSGNWLIMEMNGLAYLSIIFPEFALSKEWLSYAFDTMEAELSRQIYQDGFQYELSTNYHEVVLNNYHRLMLIANAYDIPVPKSFAAALENASEIYVKLMMPDGRLPNLNDGSNQFSSVFLKSKLDLFPHRKDFEWIVSGGVSGEKPAYRSIALPYSGFLVMRSSWEKDAVWGLLDSAPFGRGHQHEDKLSFLLFANNKLLLTEGGTYAYDSSEMRKYSLSTRSHNTIRVDGYDQNRRKNYKWEEQDIKKQSDLSYNITPEYDYCEGVYDEGYGDNGEITAIHKRSIIFIKQPKNKLNPFFIVIDRMQSSEEHSYETLWHLDSDKINLSDKGASIEGLQLLHSNAVTGKTAVYGQEFPEIQGYTINSFLQEDYRPIYALKWLSKGKSIRTVTVLYPTGKAECPIKTVTASEDINSAEITLSLSDGKDWILDERDFVNHEFDSNSSID